MTEPHLTRRQREDPLVRSWLGVQGWLEANARTLAIVVGVVAVIVAAGLLWVRARAQSEEKASAKLAEASAFYWRGQYDRVLQTAQEVRRDYGGTPSGVESLRMEGDAYFWQGDFKKAITAYQSYLQENKKASPVRLGVRRNLAQALESDHQFRPAAQIYEELAGQPAPRLILAELWLAAGRDWRAAGDNAKAVHAFQQVSRNYTDTPSAAYADEALGEIKLSDVE